MVPNPETPFNGSHGENVHQVGEVDDFSDLDQFDEGYSPERFGLDMAEARRALALLVDANHGVQIQLIPSSRRVVLPGSDMEGLCRAAAEFAPLWRITYITLNPVPVDLDHYARAADIIRRRWLMVDVDPVRPDTSVSASEAEHQAARTVALKARDHLTKRSWPLPVVVDTGNGFDLLYRIDLPNDLPSRKLLSNCLKALSLKFSGDGGGKVDPQTFKANQNLKVPGSWSRKGRYSRERPYRRVKLVDIPDKVTPVPADLLMALAATLRDAGPAREAAPTTDRPSRLTLNGVHPYAAAVLDSELRTLASTPEPGRHNQTYRSAAAVGNFITSGGLDQARVREELVGAALATGLPETEARATVADGLKKGMSEPKPIPDRTGFRQGGQNHEPPRAAAEVNTARQSARPLEPCHAFPIHVYPEPLKSYCVESAAALGCDVAFVALPVLAAVASAIGNTRTIRLKRGWDEPSVIWSVVVADSGTLKSPAWQKATSHLLRFQKHLLEEFREALKRHKLDVQKWEAAKKKDLDAAEPEKPVLSRVICSDITIEKLSEILEDNPRGVLLSRDEFNAWLLSFTRYKGKQGGSDVPNWLEISRAGSILYDRKTGDRRTIFVPRAAVSITGGIQPVVLARALSDDSFECGLVARLLMAMPDKRLKHWSEVEVNPDLEKSFEDLLEDLLDLELNRTKDGECVPHPLALSPEGKAIWVNYYNEWAKKQMESEGAMAAALGKLEGYAARFALIHHVVSKVAACEDDQVAIGPSSVEAGITLARWFAAEARRIYVRIAETTEQRDTRRLIDLIRARGGKITVKELQRSSPSRYPTSTDAKNSLDRLVKSRLAEWQDRPSTASGGRPTQDCVLKPPPTIDETDET